MTRIDSKKVSTEEAQGVITFTTGGVDRLTIAQGGAMTWPGVTAITATTGTFAAGAGTAALSGSSWTGNAGTRAYTVGDIVTALKQSGILPT